MTTTDARDSSGRFAEGNPGGPGRPARCSESAYLLAMRKAVALDDWQQICRRAVEDARGGDARARVWLAENLLGKPLPRRDNTAWMTADEVFEIGVTLGDAVAELVPDQEVCAKLAERIQDAMAGMTAPDAETSERS